MATTVSAPPKTKTTGGSFLLEDHKLDNVFTPEDFNEDQQMVAKLAEDFATNEIVPNAEKMEHKEWSVARELLQKAAGMGLTNADIPAEYGGSEMDKVSSAIIADFMAKSGSFMVSMGAHSGIGTLPIVFFGTEAQKKKYLPKLATAEMIGAYALSESTSGSDALNSRTRAVLSPDGKHYVLNGEKMWITNAHFADLFTIFAKIDGEKFTAFLVEKDFPGFSVGAEEKKMGIRGSSTAPLILNDCKVPVENVLGEIGKGHIIAFNILNVGRFKLGASCVGRRAHFPAACHRLRQRAQGLRQEHRRIRPDAREAGADGGLALRVRVDGVPHRRHDGHGALDRSSRTPSPCAKPSRSTRSSAPSSRCRRRRCSTSWWTRRCRFTAATALSRSIRPSAPIATRASTASSKAPTKSTASSSPDGC